MELPLSCYKCTCCWISGSVHVCPEVWLGFVLSWERGPPHLCPYQSRVWRTPFLVPSPTWATCASPYPLCLRTADCLSSVPSRFRLGCILNTSGSYVSVSAVPQDLLVGSPAPKGVPVFFLDWLGVGVAQLAKSRWIWLS